MSRYGYGWRPYVPVAKRRQQAEAEAKRRLKKGESLHPVRVEGRTIARTFWGQAWCDNLERYSDYANRLPRGRTYVRNGSVIDLSIGAGRIAALVSGSDVYKVAIEVSALPAASWSAIRKDCAGGIDSLVELLQGRLSKGVMERICRPRTGLFPSPKEIRLSCSCPDWATMCKHVAAVLYGVGARLDEQPELLFRLRQVDEKDLVVEAGKGLDVAAPAPDKVLDGGDLSDLFGLEMESDALSPPPPPPPPPPPAPKTTRKKKAAANDPVAVVSARVAELRAEIGAGRGGPLAEHTLRHLEAWLAANGAAST